MKAGLSYIVPVIDRSGSMGVLRRSAIEGYNGFLAEQKKLPGEALWQLVLFNTVRISHPVGPIEIVSPLNFDTYSPMGGTALLDAIGVTVEEVGYHLALMSEDDRPSKVIVVILTDGEENSSVVWTKEAVASQIQHQQEAYGWEFVFLGANMDAVAEASALNIPAANAFTYTASAAGLSDAYSTSNVIASRMRTSA